MDEIKRGDIYIADLSLSMGSEQGGIRPVVVIQNNKGNTYSPTTIVAAITAQEKPYLPTHVLIHKDSCNKLRSDSTVMTEQIRVIDKMRFKGKIGSLDASDVDKMEKALKISLEIA